MRHRLRLTAGALALTLLVGCTGPTDPGSAASSSSGKEPISSGTVVYVPLDDRPDNDERVVYLAESLGYTLAMPERDWFQTRLDGQPTNENGTAYGDRAALYEWVLAQEAAGCDRYLLSLDQLLSGGLVNSRHIWGENPVPLSDGITLTEMEMVEQLLKTLAADPDNQVWLLDTVMRLAATSGYAGFDLEGYNTLRDYGKQARPELRGEELTVDNIVADYRLSPDGDPVALSDGTTPDAGDVEEYLAARERKLRLSDKVQQLIAQPGYERFRLLIGIDDSPAEDSIQKNEIAYLRKNLRSDETGRQLDWVLSGADDLAFKAAARLYLDDSAEASGQTLAERGLGRVHVEYFGRTEDQPACAYDSQPLEEIVTEHLSFFGLEAESDRQAANVQLLALTKPEDPAKSSTIIKP